MAILGKYSIGVGDRFAHQAKAQLQACILANKAGVEVTPVWNKSNREHAIIGTEPKSVRAAAEVAVKELGWKLPWFCDADHINLTTVERFLGSCDFYTIDVADSIGKPASQASIDTFVKRHPELAGSIRMEGAEQTIEISPGMLGQTVGKFLYAVEKAGTIYRLIDAAKGKGTFVTEISMDETDAAQAPAELLIILAAIADEDIPIQTIAPKFSGRFNKGVDYVGDVDQFSREISLDMAAIKHAVAAYGLPGDLKLSIHSGSDKFSIYPAIHAAMEKFSTGVHLKTAGTTWLEEIIGLAEAGGKGLEAGKRDLRRGIFILRRALRSVCNGDRHRPGPAARARGSGPLVLSAIHLCLAPRSSIRQPTTPACASCCTWDIKWRPGWAEPLPRPAGSQ
jgi:hypothetical protein